MSYSERTKSVGDTKLRLRTIEVMHLAFAAISAVAAIILVLVALGVL